MMVNFQSSLIFKKSFQNAHRNGPEDSFLFFFFFKLFEEAPLVKSRHVVMELKEKAVMFIRGNATTLLYKVSICLC